MVNERDKVEGMWYSEKESRTIMKYGMKINNRKIFNTLSLRHVIKTIKKKQNNSSS